MAAARGISKETAGAATIKFAHICYTEAVRFRVIAMIDSNKISRFRSKSNNGADAVECAITYA